MALGGGRGALQLPCPHISRSLLVLPCKPKQWSAGSHGSPATDSLGPRLVLSQEAPHSAIVPSLTDSLRSDSGSGASLLCGLVQVTQLLRASPFFSLQKGQEASYLSFSLLAVAAASLLWRQAAPYFLKDYLTFFFVRKELGILAP